MGDRDELRLAHKRDALASVRRLKIVGNDKRYWGQRERELIAEIDLLLAIPSARRKEG